MHEVSQVRVKKTPCRASGIHNFHKDVSGISNLTLNIPYQTIANNQEQEKLLAFGNATETKLLK